MIQRKFKEEIKIKKGTFLILTFIAGKTRKKNHASENGL